MASLLLTKLLSLYVMSVCLALVLAISVVLQDILCKSPGITGCCVLLQDHQAPCGSVLWPFTPFLFLPHAAAGTLCPTSFWLGSGCVCLGAEMPSAVSRLLAPPSLHYPELHDPGIQSLVGTDSECHF